MDDSNEPLGKLEDKDFIERVNRQYMRNLDHTKAWRDEAEEAYAFVANQQWDDEARMKLEEEGRPPVSFNRAEVFVQAVCGLETINRQEVRYLARRPGPNGGAADIWSQAAKYVNDDCDAENHHSAAFKDMVICGMGWTDTMMSYDTNPDGDIDIERGDPLYHFWDHRATHRNLADARWVARVIPMTREEIEEQWPEKKNDLSFNRMFDPPGDGGWMHMADRAWKYENDQSKHDGLNDSDLFVLKYQWYETEKYYRVKNPRDGSIKEFTISQWNTYKEKYPELMANLRAVGPIPKRTYKQAYIVGWTVLEQTTMDTEGFTIQCMTGKQDRNNNVWYGLMRNLKTPQEWTNKFFSQIMHIINSNAKGGIFAEKDAFDNVSQAETTFAAPDKITWVQSGAIQGGKIQEKKPLPYPDGLDRLLNFCLAMFVEVTGMNLELLGMTDKVQPGVLEAQRKQAGMTMLAWAFDSMRAYRKRHGRILATFIREYIADNRLIRIAGEAGEQFVPLVRDELAQEYDIVVTESPHSVNEKERVLAILQNMAPVMANMGVMPPKEILDYLPLPVTLIEDWKKNLVNPEQQQAQQRAQQLAEQDQQAEIKKKEADAAYKTEQAKAKPIEAQATMIKAMN